MVFMNEFCKSCIYLRGNKCRKGKEGHCQMTKSNETNEEKRCINQMFAPKSQYEFDRFWNKIQGQGNCYECIADDKNCQCTAYKPLSIMYFEVI